MLQKVLKIPFQQYLSGYVINLLADQQLTYKERENNNLLTGPLALS